MAFRLEQKGPRSGGQLDLHRRSLRRQIKPGDIETEPLRAHLDLKASGGQPIARAQRLFRVAGDGRNPGASIG